AHPPAQAKLLGFALREVAKADALDVAVHHRVEPFQPLYARPMPLSSIVAIGDELVGGFTLDTNSHWMAERLRLLGYPLKRVTQIRDKPQEIVDQVHRELA